MTTPSSKYSHDFRLEEPVGADIFMTGHTGHEVVFCKGFSTGGVANLMTCSKYGGSTYVSSMSYQDAGWRVDFGPILLDASDTISVWDCSKDGSKIVVSDTVNITVYGFAAGVVTTLHTIVLLGTPKQLSYDSTETNVFLVLFADGILHQYTDAVQLQVVNNSYNAFCQISNRLVLVNDTSFVMYTRATSVSNWASDTVTSINRSAANSIWTVPDGSIVTVMYENSHDIWRREYGVEWELTQYRDTYIYDKSHTHLFRNHHISYVDNSRKNRLLHGYNSAKHDNLTLIDTYETKPAYMTGIEHYNDNVYSNVMIVFCSAKIYDDTNSVAKSWKI